MKWGYQIKEPYSTDRDVVLRAVVFLEKNSIHYENHLDVFIIACYIRGMLGDPVAIKPHKPAKKIRRHPFMPQIKMKDLYLTRP